MEFVNYNDILTPDMFSTVKVVSADELRDDEEYNDIVEDMREEGAKFGIQTFCIAYCNFTCMSRI